ncbi:MAG TPA: 3-phosphoshikimate 1-carboxyvinyltransferase [Verrucomicrobiae bacterium]|jgi:3-phosphoshikimate 1-carboxyvinyltransferase
MPLPGVIEILPLDAPVSATVTVPGSKSITNRALALAALAEGESVLRGALWSEDTQIMTGALRQLGFEIAVELDEWEFCNRTIRIRGQGGRIANGGTAEQPLDLFVGNAGTAARFLAALVCLGRGVYRLRGVERMRERPQAALVAALRELGYRVDSANGRLPLEIHGGGPRPGRCQVDISESSQFASALLLCAGAGGWTVECSGQSEEEAPYVAMTRQLVAAFPSAGGEFQIEADASSASYFCGAGWLMRPGAAISVAAFPKSDWQIDAAFPRFLPLPAEVSRRRDLGDSIMTAIVLAPFGDKPARFRDLERLRAQECERVAALKNELAKCGAKVVEEENDLTVFPAAGGLHGAQIETYNDHRMAMCFAILGLKIGGICIKNPSCVKKTFPNFFQKLAGRPPAGLGAAILDARAASPLAEAELFAE